MECTPHQVTKLRSEATAERMTAFEMDLLQQELKVAKDAAGAMVACMQVLTTAPAPLSPQVAKDAAGAMEAQLQRMHAENASLREGGGLEDELLVASEQVSLVNCH